MLRVPELHLASPPLSKQEEKEGRVRQKNPTSSNLGKHASIEKKKEKEEEEEKEEGEEEEEVTRILNKESKLPHVRSRLPSQSTHSLAQSTKNKTRTWAERPDEIFFFVNMLHL